MKISETERKLESKTIAASMSCDTTAQLDKYAKLVKEFAAKVDAGLLTIDEAARMVSMRCYVASKLGDSVEIPDQLLGG